MVSLRYTALLHRHTLSAVRGQLSQNCEAHERPPMNRIGTDDAET